MSPPGRPKGEHRSAQHDGPPVDAPKPIILVVDDDADARLVMGAALRKAGYAVRVATGGHDALVQFRAEAADLVMLDVEMPDLGGYEVCRLLRVEAGPLLPVVMVTGMGDLESVEFAYECGATDFISKPVHWALVGHRVRHLLRSSMAMQDLQSAEARIAKLAYFDSLTGLPNRLKFLDSVNQAIRRAEADDSQLALLFIDLDHFKAINDTLGHAAGDQLLTQAAERLRLGLRPSDILTRPAELDPLEASPFDLARLGGDEFTALLNDVKDPDAALAVARRIGTLMRQPFVIDGRDVTVSASLGISMYPQDGRSAADLLKHADTAMYHAKRSGRDRLQAYNASLTEEALKQMELESSLHGALERQEFHLVYQPQLDVESGRIKTVEALLRWTHPVRGLVPLRDFIALAEQCGLMEAISDWVLRTACRQAVLWAAAGLPISVAVNLSPIQFRAPDLATKIIGVLAQEGLDPARLEVEVTEGALMEDTDLARQSLAALCAHGVRLALDDFGTGYSSLAHITRMPIDHIKIDRCFVNDLHERAESESVVRAVLAIAQSLGLRVTAEGIETAQQAQTMVVMGCHTLQGYHISRPVPAEQIPALCARQWPMPCPQAPERGLLANSRLRRAG